MPPPKESDIKPITRGRGRPLCVAPSAAGGCCNKPAVSRVALSETQSLPLCDRHTTGAIHYYAHSEHYTGDQIHVITFISLREGIAP